MQAVMLKPWLSVTYTTTRWCNKQILATDSQKDATLLLALSTTRHLVERGVAACVMALQHQYQDCDEMNSN